jgi:hypothetical protein
MIKKLSLALAAALAALLLFATTRPDTFRVQRSVRVQAPPERIHALIDDLRRFNTWNPFAKKDPAMKGSYRGAAQGPGAAFDFEGGKSGSGSIEIVAPASPTGVSMRLDMTAPFACHNLIDFSLVPQAAGSATATEVTWAMHGPSPFLSKVMGIFIDMDKMIGADFEAGLADLKALAERPDAS